MLEYWSLIRKAAFADRKIAPEAPALLEEERERVGRIAAA